MFDGLLKSKFYNKCKTAIKLTKTRLESIKKKRSAVEKYLKNDIADLLKNGLDQNAYGRAEGLMVEQNMSCCYDLIDQFCVSISSNLSVMQKQSECPEECKEAVPSLMFAAARFADLPELRELRTVFAEKYGTSLDAFVNKEFVGRLKAGPPTKDMKIQLMREIAAEYSLRWDPKALEKKNSAAPLMVHEHPKYASKEEARDESHRRSRKERLDLTPKRETEAIGSKLPYREQKRDERPLPFHRPIETNDHHIAAAKLNSSSQGDREQQQYLKEGTNPARKPSYRNIPPPYIKWKPVEDENKAKENEEAQEATNEPKKPMSVRQNRSRLPPGRAASLPAEAISPIETAKGHGGRAMSFQDEMFVGHVHPNLPADFDDLASRIASLRGR